VSADVHAAHYGRNSAAVLLDESPAGFLDRSPALDDAGGGGRALVGRLLKDGSQQRARCARVMFAERKTS